MRLGFRALGVLCVPFAIAIGVACGNSNGSQFDNGGAIEAGVPDDSNPGPGFGEAGLADASPKNNAMSIAWNPPSKTLTVDGKTPASQDYTLVATLKDGAKVTVIPDSVQFDRPDIASAALTSVTTLTTPGQYAGTGTLHGVYGTLAATATLSVVVARKDLGSVTAPIAAALDAATTADPSVTSLLYPYDKTVFALGLASPKIMWNAPNAGDTYRFHLEQANYTYDVYSAVAQPGQFRIDQAVWDLVTTSNKAAAGPVTLKVSRYDAASMQAYVSATETFTIAPESLRGAIYYWTASKDANGKLNGHISRFRPGTGATPVQLNNGKCMGCHAVNAQGTVLVGDIDDEHEDPDGGPNSDPSVSPYGNWSGTRPWASFDVSDPNNDAGAKLVLETNKFGADIALTPDGTYVVFGGPTPAGGGGTVQPGSKFMSLAKVADGIVIPTSGLDSIALAAGRGVQQPAFSPDGTKLAVVVSSTSADNVIPDDTNTSIAFLDFNQAGPSFASTIHPLVDGADAVFDATTGHGLAYPSFTPDSKAVAFHVGLHASGCQGACDNTVVDDGNLFIQTVANGGVSSPIHLGAASDPPDPTEAALSVEPTFNPQERGGYSWVVFTSMRTWGNVPFPVGTSPGHVNGKRRLWVAAVDATIGAVDPSHPAIFLEGQEDTPNMRGFWANAACTATAPPGNPSNKCSAGYECCSGFCVSGSCVDPSTVACAGAGASCKTSGDCCNPDAVACVDSVCKPGSIH